MKLFLNFLVSILWIYTSTATKLDYYWKDFNGDIPEDAFVGGQDWYPIYVGQGYFKGAGIIPATIYHNSPTITVTERGNNPVISKNIMILCTQNAQALQWVPINYSDIKVIEKISFLKIVEAGTESDAPMFVGRHLHEGSMQIAKVYNVSPYEGINVPNKNGGGTNFKDFEILIYCTIC